MKAIFKVFALSLFSVVASAVVEPKVAAPAQAQENPQFRDVPRDHWAYKELSTLTRAGLIEGNPPYGDFLGTKPLTRYEFAISIARMADRHLTRPPVIYDFTSWQSIIDALKGQVGTLSTTTDRHGRDLADMNLRDEPDIFKPEVLTAIEALRREFRDELAHCGANIDALDKHVSMHENSDPVQPRFSSSLALESFQGSASYISNFGADPPANRGGFGGDGRVFLNGLPGSNDPGTTAALTAPRDGDTGKNASLKKFSYTDLEIRLQDRVRDSVDIIAALRASGDTSEDPWAGNSRGRLYAREAFAEIYSPNRIRPDLTIGRQRTTFGSGLLYDNQFAPTDQLRADWKRDSFQLTTFIGSTSGIELTGNRGNPYASEGAVGYLRQDSGVGTNTAIGFPDGKSMNREDDEAAVRASATVFRLKDRPVVLGLSKLADGYGFQEGRGADLNLPLFGHDVGFEYVQQEAYAAGGQRGFIHGNKPEAYTVALPILKANQVDVNFAYGRASSDFEFFAASSANPYARTYGAALFDRPNALGAPMLAANGQFVAAKETLDVTATARRRTHYIHELLLNLRYYRAKDGAGTTLGEVYSAGVKYPIVTWLEVEAKGGVYDSRFSRSDVHYARVSANLGF